MRQDAPADGPEGDAAADVLAALRAAPQAEEAPDRTEDALAALRAAAPAATVERDDTADILGGLAATGVGMPEPERDDTTADTLAALRDAAPADEAPADTTSDTLAALRDAAPQPVEEADTTQAVLAGLAEQSVPDADPDTATDDALAALRDAAPADEAVEDDQSAGILAGLRDVAQPDELADDGTDDILSGLARVAVEDAALDHGTDDILAGIATGGTGDAPADDGAEDILAGLAGLGGEDTVEPDLTDDILSGLSATEPSGEAEDDRTGDVLASLRDLPVEEAAEEDATDLLAELAAGVEADRPADDGTGDILAGLATAAVDDATDGDGVDDILAGLAGVSGEDTPAEPDATEDILSGLATGAVEETAEGDGAEDILAGIAAGGTDDLPAGDDADDILASLAGVGGEDAVEPDATEDILAGLATAEGEEEPAGLEADDILAGLGTVADDDGPADDGRSDDGADDILADLAAFDEGIEEVDTSADDVLSALGGAALEETAEETDQDNVLAGIAAPSGETEVRAANDDLDDLLGDLGQEAAEAGMSETDALADILTDLPAPLPDAQPADEGADDLLADLLNPTAEAESDDASDLDALLSDTGAEDSGFELDALLAGAEEDASGLDALLADTGGGDPGSDLDALLAGAEEDASDLDALLSDTGVEASGSDLDALLAGAEDDVTDTADAVPSAPETPEASATAARAVQHPNGFITAPRPAPEELRRTGFRMAIFGDFTGRAARGLIEPGDGLAHRRAIPLDVDTVEEVIEGFATDLVLPVGRDGAGIKVSLTDLDSLHPDELFDNVEIFSGISGLRQRLKSTSLAPAAMAQLQKWGEAHGQRLAPPRRSSAGSAVPANLKLGAFQQLIGDTGGRLTQASPIDDMVARIIGPHVTEAANPDAGAMLAAVDAALSSAMRLILHHPEFQSVEALWRSLDFLARRIETDVKLTIDLYDVSAEELAVDLAADDDLSESGFLRLLTERPLGEEGPGGYSALFGLYTFEETPPHAELLARIAQVAAHVDAPFFTAISPAFLEVAKEDRHPLVAKAWDALRALPEAAYLGVATPRFLLRRPYGERTDPVDAFDFEEFTEAEGLSGMLWANPVLLVAVLLGMGWSKHGKQMSLGSVMSIGDIPFHYVKDRHGDQVALPHTERNLTTSKVQNVVTRGYQPVLSIRGRDEIRLGSFQSLAGEEIRGRWTGVPMPPKAPPPTMPGAPAKPADIEMEIPAPDSGGSDDLDALLSGLDGGEETSGGDDLDALLAGLDTGDATGVDGGGAGDDDLDALLAGFDDLGTSETGDDGMDPELAALLEGL
nr:type VI secretion system contractile sheath large subunit [Defluviimonas sp. WL0075]